MTSEDQLLSPLADLTLSSPVVEQTPFPLLELPDELIELILEHAYASALPCDSPHAPTEYGLRVAHLPVCRRIWTIQQHVLYRRIEINTYDQLGNITRALVDDRPVDRPRLGTLVRALELDTDNYQLWRGLPGIGDEIGPGVPGLAASLLAQLLGELGGLQWLKFSVMYDMMAPRSPVEQALLAVLVQDPTTPAKLSGLKSLNLCTTGRAVVEGEGQVDDVAAWMDQFGQFAELVNLEIYLLSEESSSFIQRASQRPTVLAKLSRLLINADFARWSKPLRDAAPSLVDLEIFSTSRTLRPLILGAPPSLLHLDILSAGNPVECIDDLLPSLFLLQSLSLGLTCYETARLSASLGQLRHLESLEFGYGCEVSDGLLLGLVDGPTRLLRLRSLTVHAVFSRRGPSLLRTKLVLPATSERDESLGWYGWRGWVAPHWPAGLSEAGLARVVDAAHAHRVRVKGLALRTFGWRAAYERERAVVAVCRGLSTGDWSEARRYVDNGDERVDSYLTRRQREGRRRSLGHELSLL